MNIPVKQVSEEEFVQVWTAPTVELSSGYTDDEFGSDEQIERILSDHE